MIKNLLTLCSICLLGFATAAHANEIFTLNSGACCGTAPFGTVDLAQEGSGTSSYVQVTETLVSNEVFSESSGKEALEFDVSGAGTISIAILDDPTGNFSVDAAPYSAPPYGSFPDAVHCASCKGGKLSNPGGPLEFDVTSATGVLLSDFISNGNAYFASDILGNNGLTGDVAATSFYTTPPTAVTPEPSSLLLLGTGIVGAAGMLRRRTHAAINRA